MQLDSMGRISQLKVFGLAYNGPQVTMLCVVQPVNRRSRNARQSWCANSHDTNPGDSRSNIRARPMLGVWAWSSDPRDQHKTENTNSHC
ncbi:hypothetical protein PoB_001529000 [Plakobranchus ocellatus]|uniref:Uncharacterized protein n=1 Tax=Plakobranchus ocellatus TaxID=259542 RepID=A0AAV3Z0S8_9GAST|nr:hypothetical protein PoB_001529000 [Plakobranchus ocellatus]